MKVWRLLGCLALVVALSTCTRQGGGVPTEAPPAFPGEFIKAAENPILTNSRLTGSRAAWDYEQVGLGSAIKEGDTYYLYYHGGEEASGHMQIGVATSRSPRGPWRKLPANPILRTGSPGSWEDSSVDRPRLAKVGGTYYMFYEGQQRRREGEGYWWWRIGLATASAPEGPWAKHPANPILDRGKPGEWDSIGIYLGSAVCLKERCYLWYSGFDHDLDQDGSIGLATAASPEGPWTKHPANPVLSPVPGEAWNQKGLQEPFVLYRGGGFRMWVAGLPEGDPWFSDIGYYFSRDGINWERPLPNPVLGRGGRGEWDEVNVSEPAILLEGEDIYLFYMGLTKPPHPVQNSSVGLAVGRWLPR